MTAVYLERVLQAKSEIEGPNPESWYDRLEREESELEAALEAACKDNPALGLRVAPPLQRFWFARGRLERGRRWIERLLTAAGDRPTVERGQGLFAVAAIAFRQGDNEAARRYALEALALAQRFKATELQLDAEGVLARVGLRDRDVNAVRQHAEPARELARELHDEARELSALHCLAEGARIARDYRLARALYNESLERNRARRNRLMVSVELTNLAMVENKEGNLSRAEANLREAVGISREINNSYILAGNLLALATVAASAGRPRDAARYLGRADAIYSSTGLVIDPADKPEYDQALAAARSQLSKADFDAAYAEGAKSSIEALVQRP